MPREGLPVPHSSAPPSSPAAGCCHRRGMARSAQAKWEAPEIRAHIPNRYESSASVDDLVESAPIDLGARESAFVEIATSVAAERAQRRERTRRRVGAVIADERRRGE